MMILLSILTLSSWGFTLGTSNNNDLEGWNAKELSISINYSGCPFSEAKFNTLLDNALKSLNEIPSSNLFLKRGGSSQTTLAEASAGDATDSPLILCDTEFDQSPEAVAGFAAFQFQNNRINYGYIVLNALSGASANISSFNDTLIEVILAHEIAHVLGLGHSSEERALMYYNVSGKDHLSLAQDDVDGITYLYPRNELLGEGVLGCSSVVAGQGQKPGPENLWFILIFSGIWLFFRRSRKT